MSTTNIQQTGQQKGLKSSTREKIGEGFLIAAGIFAMTSFYAFVGCAMSNFHSVFLATCATALVIAGILAIIGQCIKPEKPAPKIVYVAPVAQQQRV